MVWSAVASIGGSLISGLFGSKKRKEETITDQTSSSTIDYKGLADAAIAGGFNPLTAIRTGGASGFVTTRTTGKNVTTSSGGGGVGAAIGDAIASAGASGLFGSFNTPKNDPIRVKSKSTGAVSNLVSSQLRGGTRAAPALNVQPTQRVLRSPVTARPPIPGLAATPPVKAEKGPDAWVRIWDPVLGRYRWGVNPDGADLEQSLNAVVEGGAAVLYDAFTKSREQLREAGKRGLVTSRPATPTERWKSENSWHRGWLPSIGFNWK